ncbi:MAG: protein kinase [Sandaracinaceae bacterium]|nr:protein kinase [Sandaracinaceae bacterium]
MSASSEPTEDEPTGLGVKLPYQLGRLTLCRELGAGGMATVYLGRMRMAEGFDRLSAIKTIHNHLARAQAFVDMFLDEAKIASQISHPNVCSVYDFGTIGGTYFLALEYLMGEPLHEVVNRIAASRNEDLMQALPYIAARILADACEGLHAAHETRGPDGQRLDIVHRDVSPQNLFVTYDGAVKVVDFGCAKAVQRVTQTDTGIMKGKVSYAAPEQLKVGDIDARVDVWALGVCLWEVLTLQELFRRESAIMSAMAVLEEPIPRADQAAPWVPRQLADIAEKALQRDVSQRYASARQMGRDLRGFIARAGVSFESAELADWMDYLFAERQREVRAMVAEVEGARVSGVGARAEPKAPVSAVMGDAPTRLAKVQSGPEKAGAWFEEVPAAEAQKPKRALRLDPEPEEPVVLPTRGRGWLWATLAILLLAGGGYAGARAAGIDPIAAAMAMTQSEPATPTVATEEPTTPEPAPADTTESAAPMDDEATAAAPAEPAQDEATAIEEPAEAGAVPAAPAEPAPAATPVQPARPPTQAITQSSGAPRRGETARPQPAPAPAEPPATAEPRSPSASLDTSQGEVVVAVEGGWAQVFHGDRSLGRTPVRVRLPVGEQRLRLLPYGREPAQHVVVPVEWGAINRVTLRVGPPPSEEGAEGAEPSGDGT